MRFPVTDVVGHHSALNYYYILTAVVFLAPHRSRYFRGKRFFGDFEIHVEQADIKDLTVTASAEKGCTVSMVVLSPSGSRVVRSFRPDFFLCRQSVRDAGKDYRNVLLGLNIGGVPSINSLNSLYNFQVVHSWCQFGTFIQFAHRGQTDFAKTLIIYVVDVIVFAVSLIFCFLRNSCYRYIYGRCTVFSLLLIFARFFGPTVCWAP